MRTWTLLTLLALAGCAAPDCKKACEAVQKCGLKTDGLDCESNCKDSFDDRSCAGCLESNADNCEAIKRGCPGSCKNHQF